MERQSDKPADVSTQQLQNHTAWMFNVTYDEICVHHFEYKSKNQRLEWKHP